jgi:glycosyltransferase involved in cell wall biosynthesis
VTVATKDSALANSADRAHISVAHVITDLSVVGGAERMTLKLAEHLPAQGVSMHVVSLGDKGELGELIERAGVPVLALGMHSALQAPAAITRLARHLRLIDADVVTTWLYHASLVGTLANLVAGRRQLVWNLRNSDLGPDGIPPVTRWIRALLARVAWLPDLVLSNSQAGLDDHVKRGYRPRASKVIPNGFDTQLFRPDAGRRAAARREFGLADGDVAIGMAARYAPQKDHAGFLASAAIALSQRHDLRFLLAGAGSEADGAVGKLARSYGLGDRLTLVGRRLNMATFFSALDVATLTSSAGEGFPNVVGEAMACGVPCVSTRVGDTASIIGEAGVVVPPGSPDAMAQAWIRMANVGPDRRRAIGEVARQRIVEHYDIAVVAQAFAETYRRLANRAP